MTLNNKPVILNGMVISIGDTPTWKCLNFCDLSSTCPNYDNNYECTCACLYATPAMSSGDQYQFYSSYFIYKDMTDAPYEQYVCIKCNGVCVAGASISTHNNDKCNGMFAPITVNYGDCLHVITKAEMAGGEMGYAYSQFILGCVYSLSGCFCFGDNYSVLSETYGM